MFFGYWVYETECHRFAAEVAMARNGIPSMAQCRHGEHRPSSDARQLTVNAPRACREGRGHLDVTLIGMPLIHARGRVS